MEIGTLQSTQWGAPRLKVVQEKMSPRAAPIFQGFTPCPLACFGQLSRAFRSVLFCLLSSRV